MKNTIFRLLAVLLAALVGIDTAAACRWLRSCSRCKPVCAPACEPACQPACPEWTTPQATCGGCDSCGETVVETHAAPSVPEVIVSEVPTPAAPPEPVQVYEPASSVEAFGQTGFRSDSPSTPEEPMPSPSDWDAGLETAPPAPTAIEDAPTEPTVVQEAPEAIEDPVDDLFATPAVAEEPAAEEPVIDEEPANDLFAAPAAEPADDLFGAPADEPVEEPAGDSLFGDEPAEEPADDLFGEQPTEEPAGDDLFNDEPAGDDLFGEPAPPEPAEASPADDLFGAPADEPVEEPAGDDLFGDEPSADEPTNDEEDLFGAPPEDEGDDLFGEPTNEDDDDLFGLGATLREAGGFYSAKDRTWIDNTGRYSMVGRLIAMDGSAVRLAKQDGSVATVPLARLSQADLEFVSRQSLAQSQIREWAIANGKSPLEGLRTAQR